MAEPPSARPWRARRGLLARAAGGVAAAALGLWRAADLTRRVLLNLLLLAGFAALLLWWLGPFGPPKIGPQTVLVLDLKGSLVEQPRSRVVRGFAGLPLPSAPGNELVLRELLTAIDAAAEDPRIVGALLLLDDFGGGGLASLTEVADALARLRAKGKKLVASSLRYDQADYLLAAQAERLLLHPMGQVGLEGFGRQRGYYREALERLGVQVHLLRAGQYKNAGEPFVADAPSPASLEAEAALWGDLWTAYAARIEQARKLSAGAVARHIDALPASLTAQGGDAAKLALADRLVDALSTPDELRAAMRAIGRAEGKSFAQIGWREYLAQAAPAAPVKAPIAVVVAEGNIVERRAGPGSVGGLSTAALIRKVREDDEVKALVLRVNSPGGSAVGSELIRRELELTRAAGKPVVVSMGDIAASGGYWIALAADELIADPSTITGSIGVFVMLPSFERAYERLGLKSGGATTSWLRGAYDPRRGLDPRLRTMLQAGVDRIYADFIAKAAQARKREPAAVEPYAQGRVWSGRRALEHGLVDRHGRLADALLAAARRAGLPEAAARTPRYVEVEPGGFERWLRRWGVGADGWPMRLAAWVDGWLGADGEAHEAWLADWPQGVAAVRAALAPAAARPDTLVDDLAWLLAQADGRGGVQAHCLCRATLD
jgi:protease-4